MELNVVTEADEASWTKVNFNEGSDEDALEVRGGTAHFDISWSKRPRPTFAQRRSFTKSRPDRRGPAGASF